MAVRKFSEKKKSIYQVLSGQTLKAKWVVQTKVAIFFSQLLARLFDCQCKFEKIVNWATLDSSSSSLL